MHKYIPPDQIYERFGGTLKEPEVYWPPVIHPSKDLNNNPKAKRVKSIY